MNNLHQIRPGISDEDYAVFWWESREGFFGELVKFKDLLFRYSEYTKRYLPITEYTPDDIKYVMERWRAMGSPKLKIREVTSLKLD